MNVICMRSDFLKIHVAMFTFRWAAKHMAISSRFRLSWNPVASISQQLTTSHLFLELGFPLTMSTTTTTPMPTVQVFISLGGGSPHVTATTPQGSHNRHQFNTRHQTRLTCPGLTHWTTALSEYICIWLPTRTADWWNTQDGFSIAQRSDNCSIVEVFRVRKFLMWHVRTLDDYLSWSRDRHAWNDIGSLTQWTKVQTRTHLWNDATG